MSPARLLGRPPGLLAVPALVLGAAVAVLALVTHRDAARVAGVLLPWGLALAVVGSVLPSLALAAIGAGRAAVVAYGGGWCLTVLLLMNGRNEGDYLVAADARGWGFLAIATLAVVAATLWCLAAGGATGGGAVAAPDGLGRPQR